MILLDRLKHRFEDVARDRRKAAVALLAPQIKAACLSRNYIRYEDDDVVLKSAEALIDHYAGRRAATLGGTIAAAEEAVIDIILADGGAVNLRRLLCEAPAAVPRAKAEKEDGINLLYPR